MYSFECIFFVLLFILLTICTAGKKALQANANANAYSVLQLSFQSFAVSGLIWIYFKDKRLT